MHHSAQRPSGVLGGRTSCSATPGCGDIALDEDDFGAAFQVGEVRPLLVGGSASTVENDASGAAVDEPASDDHAQPAETAGDDVRAVRTDDWSRSRVRRSVARESRSA